jgi:hypothetical protein
MPEDDLEMASLLNQFYDLDDLHPDLGAWHDLGQQFKQLAQWVATRLGDHTAINAGLRKLLEARQCLERGLY